MQPPSSLPPQSTGSTPQDQEKETATMTTTTTAANATAGPSSNKPSSLSRPSGLSPSVVVDLNDTSLRSRNAVAVPHRFRRQVMATTLQSPQQQSQQQFIRYRKGTTDADTVQVVEIHHHHHHLIPESIQNEVVDDDDSVGDDHDASSSMLIGNDVMGSSSSSSSMAQGIGARPYSSYALWGPMLQQPHQGYYVPKPLPAGSNWNNPIPQMSFTTPTVQNNFTWIFGCIICWPTTFVCVVIWLVVFGVFAYDDVFRSPW